jgi:diaminopimelate epimerase
MDETGAASVDLRTGRGLLRAEEAGDGLIRVNMGPPVEHWATSPSPAPSTSTPLPLALPIGRPSAVGMGNPHCVFVVPDAEAAPVAELGPRVERDPLFPERTNVEFVQVLDRATIRMRVWERGLGVTLACGSGACAAAVAARAAASPSARSRCASTAARSRSTGATTASG